MSTDFDNKSVKFESANHIPANVCVVHVPLRTVLYREKGKSGVCVCGRDSFLACKRWEDWITGAFH